LGIGKTKRKGDLIEEGNSPGGAAEAGEGRRVLETLRGDHVKTRGPSCADRIVAT